MEYIVGNKYDYYGNTVEIKEINYENALIKNPLWSETSEGNNLPFLIQVNLTELKSAVKN